MDEGGKQALLRLCGGDMRRVLNSLQACHAAFGLVTEENVYLTTGAPIPADIDTISHILFNEEYAAAYTAISALKSDKGLALTDILTQLAIQLSDMEVPAHVRAFMLDRMSVLEYDLNSGATESLQLAALLGIYKAALEMVGNAGK
jgi:replication factor C subunit 3/5